MTHDTGIEKKLFLVAWTLATTQQTDTSCSSTCCQAACCDAQGKDCVLRGSGRKAVSPDDAISQPIPTNLQHNTNSRHRVA
jgi:hypothetical protein